MSSPRVDAGFGAYMEVKLSKTRWIYWGIVASLTIAGLSLSIVKRDGHYAFRWDGAELMAQTREDTSYHDIAALQVFNRVLLQLQRNYVDPSRLDPNLMLVSSLDNLQKSLPELLLVFDKPIKESPSQVTARIGSAEKTFSLENIGNLWEMSLRLRSVLRFVQEYLPADAKPRELEYDAINGMLMALDPHSVILSPELYRNMMEGNRGKFGGLGIVVRMVDGVLIVVEPVDDDVPARRAGIEEGDQILSIDGTPTLNMNITEAVDLLKGDPDTVVHLSVMRKGWKSPRDIDVTRAEINIPSVESAQLDDNIAYIKLKSFQGNSQREIDKALAKFNSEMGGIHGLILDLRGNPGGLLDQAVMIADNFLASGTIVTTVGVTDTLSQTRKATKGTTQADYPIVVLIDSASASASEIVAGALKNNDRALIVGDTSFGKGSVQVLYELPDKSALKLTIGQYLTPGNLSIQSVGIVPDIRLVPMVARDGDIDLYPKPWVRREESLGGHLVNQKAVKDQKPSYALRYLSQRYALPEDAFEEDSVITLEDVDKIIKAKPKSKKPGDDPQVRLAEEILKRTGNANDREVMIEKFIASADSLQSEEDKILVSALEERGIDWQKGQNPENPQLRLELSTDKPDNRISAGDTYVIRATATNLGDAPLYRVSGRTESTFGRVDDKEFIFGYIAPGASVTREMTIKTNRAQTSRVDNLRLGLYLDDGTPIPEKQLASSEIELETVERPQPDFAIHYAIIDDDGRSKNVGNSLLDDDETVTVRLWVSNDGTGTAEKPLVFLKNKSKEIKLLDARAETGALAAGERFVRDFTFKTTKVSSADVAMQLHVYDKASTRMLVENIAFKTSKSDDIETSRVEKAEGNVVLNEEAKLYVSPTPTSNALIRIPAGAIVKRDAVVGDFTHIKAGEAMGWVESTALDPSTQTHINSVDPKTIVTIPRVKLEQMPHVTDSDSFELRAAVTGFAPLKDYYIYTAYEIDHEYQYQKVAYGTISGDQSQIAATIPLHKGLNTVRLYVRDANKSEAYERVLVYRR